jgi:hypothetical protein
MSPVLGFCGFALAALPSPAKIAPKNVRLVFIMFSSYVCLLRLPVPLRLDARKFHRAMVAFGSLDPVFPIPLRNAIGNPDKHFAPLT